MAIAGPWRVKRGAGRRLEIGTGGALGRDNAHEIASLHGEVALRGDERAGAAEFAEREAGALPRGRGGAEAVGVVAEVVAYGAGAAAAVA